jgi:hypothetical protein
MGMLIHKTFEEKTSRKEYPDEEPLFHIRM